MHVWKSKRVPFTFFVTVRHFPKEKNFRKFQVFFPKNVLRFLSLRYSADFRRSRLVCFFSHVLRCSFKTFLKTCQPCLCRSEPAQRTADDGHCEYEWDDVSSVPEGALQKRQAQVASGHLCSSLPGRPLRPPPHRWLFRVRCQSKYIIIIAGFVL